MVLGRLGTGNQQTRDELGSEPSLQTIHKIKNEKVLLEEGPLETKKKTIGHSFILSHLINGIMGTAQPGVDGSQILLGEHNRVETLLGMVNINKLFIERFSFDTYKDAVETTADWDTVGSAALKFTGPGGTAQSKAFARNDGTITRAILTHDTSAGTTTVLSYFIAANETDFEKVTAGSAHTFENTGTTGIWRITSTGTATIDNLKINYR